ncbi:hypothetical protein DPMN_085594 [Dreissena polymorpha]|uniref:Uncharacterized protein n=1 Tax=Dreissena polymorpha TaxID=45954 RepID=A0A9D4BM26_DREPO|nr:hypothetical protein DPMN_085594 [Dreissena polymorpha]
MFGEILARLGPRITKQRNNYRLPIEPGMKLVIALRHLVSDSKYRDMRQFLESHLLTDHIVSYEGENELH